MTDLQHKIVAEITVEMYQWHFSQPKDKSPISHYCLWWAKNTVNVLHRYGLKAQIQAGTASWRVVKPEDDDGFSALNYVYEFEWNRRTLNYVAAGGFPEIHVWAAIAPKDCPEGRGQLIDLTAQYVLQRAKTVIPKATINYPLLWCYTDDLPSEVRYAPRLQAIEIAYSAIRGCDTGISSIRVLEPFEGT